MNEAGDERVDSEPELIGWTVEKDGKLSTRVMSKLEATAAACAKAPARVVEIRIVEPVAALEIYQIPDNGRFNPNATAEETDNAE